MAVKPDEITSVLKAQLDQYKSQLEVTNVGYVLQVGDGIARVFGLERAMAGELVEFENDENSPNTEKTKGMVLNLEESNVGVVILGESLHIKEGIKVSTTGRIASTPVGENLLGRVVNPIGEPIDGKGSIQAADNSEKYHP